MLLLLSLLQLGAVWQAPPKTPARTPAKGAAMADQPPVVVYDMTPLFRLDLSDDAQRRRFWDETQLVACLQGLANRDAARLYLRYNAGPDDFWWARMTEPGGWLAGRQVEHAASLCDLLARFRRFYRGAVVWDERVPATSNLASTIAGADDLLPLRYDPSPGSLYHALTTGPGALKIVLRLMGPDGGPMFTGSGTIPGTDLSSSGSAKDDAYLWLCDRYLKTGRLDPHVMGYYLDAFWLRCWQAGAPQNCTLVNHDYLVAHRALVFDLDPWDDEAPVDDPGQRPGTDAATLKALLRTAYDRFGGKGTIHVAGFVPWAYKYTDYTGGGWSAGGHHGGVPSEWRYAEILSCYNAYMDADALGYSSMANASFFQHYPLPARIAQNPRPTAASLKKAGILDAQGFMKPKWYYAHYVGDYDSAAWLYWNLPRVWTDPDRGKVPLSWAFDPDLADRFPLGMMWSRETRTPEDFFVAGDSGAGYLNPGYLSVPRKWSGLPSGVAAWERHCQRYYHRWDLGLTGFVIDGYAPGLSEEGLDAYARFSPDGIVAQKIPPIGVHDGMPYLRMGTDLPGDPAAAARAIVGHFYGTGPAFEVCRSVLKPPSWYVAVDREVARLAGDKVRVVDLYTLMWLVRDYETRRAAYAARSEYGAAAEVSASPGDERGLFAVPVADGPLTVEEHAGAKAWRVARHDPGEYLYFAVDDGFAQSAAPAVVVEVEYLDEGTGPLSLIYDSTDDAAPMAGRYEAAPPVERKGTGKWRTATFRLSDARFAHRENGGADLRLYNPGDDLWVRRVVIRRATAG